MMEKGAYIKNIGGDYKKINAKIKDKTGLVGDPL